MKKIYWPLITVLMLGCNPSQITSSWKKPEVAVKKFDKILVLGLIGDPDRTLREKMEAHMVGDLKDLGYNAVSSVAEYGPKAFENMKEEDAVKELYNRGIDGVMTIVLLDKVKEKYYQPAWTRSNRFWGYYSVMYDRVYAPGYYMTNTKYFWETNLYDMNDWQLLYSAQSQSFEPESASNLAHQYGLMIVKDMVKNNVLGQQVKTLKSF